MKVADIMTFHVATVTPTSSFTNLWKLFFQKKINAIPVIDSKKKLVGIVTKEDLLKKLYPDYIDLVNDFATSSDFEAMEGKFEMVSGITAKDIMNGKVVFTRDDTPLMRALSRMIARRINQLPVLDEENHVVGVITKGDVFYALFKKHLKTVRTRKRLAI